MFVAMVQSYLGQWGMALYRYYEANSLWINLVILVYGTWILLSWMNLKTIRNNLIRELVIQLKPQVDLASEKTKPTQEPTLVVPWDTAIKQSRFPFVARQNAWVPRRLSVETIQAMLPVDDLTAEAMRVLHLQGGQKSN